MRLLFTFLLFYSVVCVAVAQTRSAPKKTLDANCEHASLDAWLTEPVSQLDLTLTDFLISGETVTGSVTAEALHFPTTSFQTSESIVGEFDSIPPDIRHFDAENLART